VTLNPVTHRYRLGSRVLHLASTFYQQLDLGRIALSTLRWLRDESEETSTLQVRLGDYRVCVEEVPSHHQVRRVVHVGEPYELNAGSSGKVLLAYMSIDEREALLGRLPVPHLTKASPSPQQLKLELASIAKQGFAISVDERVQGSCGIAAPVFDYRGTNIAAVGVSGPTTRLDSAARERCAKLVVEAAQRVSHTLGHDGGSGT